MTKLEDPEIIKGLEGKYKDIKQRIKQKEIKLEKLKNNLSEEDCEPIIKKGLEYIKNPYSTWESLKPEPQHKYQTWLFPDGIEYHHQTGLRTRKLCCSYRHLEALMLQDSSLVKVKGVKVNQVLDELRELVEIFGFVKRVNRFPMI